MVWLNPLLYPETTRLHIDEGMPVHYRLNAKDGACLNEGDGVVELIWLGLFEQIDVRQQNGKLVRVNLGLDEVEPVVDG